MSDTIPPLGTPDYLEWRHDNALRSLRKQNAAKEASKSPVEKMRDRLAYAATLRKKGKEATSLAEALNRRLQAFPQYNAPVTIKWRPFRGLWTIVFEKHDIALTDPQVEQIFTWCFEAGRALKANADRIEAEVAGATSVVAASGDES